VDNRDVNSRSFALVADVSSADSAAIEPVLRRLVDGEIIPTAEVRFDYDPRSAKPGHGPCT
jgi:hypothetical protein